MNTKRLANVLKWHIIGNKKAILHTMLYFAMAFSIIVFTQSADSWFERAFMYSDLEDAAQIIVIASVIVLVIMASRICFNMKTKDNFAQYAMLPATMGEKFVANLLYVTIVEAALIIGGLLITDVLQAIISILVTGNASSVTLAVFDNLSDKLNIKFSAISGQQLNLTFNSIMGYIFVHSTYVLGGTFFRKRQFLYTTLMWFFVPALITSILIGISAFVLYEIEKNGYIVSAKWLLNDFWDIVIAMIILISLTIGTYYLAFRCFCRTQLISNKFFN